MINLVMEPDLDNMARSSFNHSAHHLPSDQFKCAVTEDAYISSLLHCTQC